MGQYFCLFVCFKITRSKVLVRYITMKSLSRMENWPIWVRPATYNSFWSSFWSTEVSKWEAACTQNTTFLSIICPLLSLESLSTWMLEKNWRNLLEAKLSSSVWTWQQTLLPEKRSCYSVLWRIQSELPKAMSMLAGHREAYKSGDWCILWGKVIMDKFGVLYWILIGKDEKHWKKVMTL